MKKTLFALFLAFMFAGTVLAQSPTLIKFDNEQHDYGKVKEEDGDAVHKFTFTNISSNVVRLTSVKPSCGCTSPNWSKEDVAPGKTGEIIVSYNTKNRPGPIANKSVNVQVNAVDNIDPNGNAVDPAKTQHFSLKITGEVIPRPKGPEDWYRFADGNLRFLTNRVNFGDVNKKEIKTEKNTIYNQGEAPITISSVNVAAHITFNWPEGKTIKPKDSLHFEVTYDANKVNDYDYLYETATLTTDDKDNPSKRIYVNATVKPYFPEMTAEQKAKAPKIEFDKQEHDFGNIDDQVSQNTKFLITNKGGSELEIYKTKASCGCTASQPTKTKLAPGESTDINVTFNPSGKSGVTQKTITVVSNDPTNSTIVLKIKSNITPKEKPEEQGAAPATPAPTPVQPAQPTILTAPASPTGNAAPAPTPTPKQGEPVKVAPAPAPAPKTAEPAKAEPAPAETKADSKPAKEEKKEKPAKAPKEKKEKPAKAETTK